MLLQAQQCLHMEYCKTDTKETVACLRESGLAESTSSFLCCNSFGIMHIWQTGACSALSAEQQQIVWEPAARAAL